MAFSGFRLFRFMRVFFEGGGCQTFTVLRFFSFLRSLSEALFEGGSVAMAERIFTNAYMALGIGAKTIFCIVANFSPTIKAK